MSELLDRTAPPREDERLDPDRLGACLQAHIPDLVLPLEIEQFPRGHSNLTYLVRSGAREWVLRRPPFGGERVKTAHDMGREYTVLSKLHGHFPLAPRPLYYCDDQQVIGAPFYLMERVQGVILRRELPSGLSLTPDQARRLSESFIDTLAQLHQLDYKGVGLGDFGKPDGYCRRQVTGWTQRYRHSQTDDIPEVEAAAAWLAERIPEQGGAAIIHNDYKYDNVVLDPADVTRIIGVLDWEMATIGDPLMDLGTTLAMWVNHDDPPEAQMMRLGPTHLPGTLTRAQLAARYGERTGTDTSGILFYFVYGLFKVAVVAQQIYYRYAKGMTKDDRFSGFIHFVRLLSQQAVRAAQSGTI